MGIEPSRPAWKAGALPLSYTRRKTGPLADSARQRPPPIRSANLQASGGGRIRTCEGVRHQIYSLAHLATLEHPRNTDTETGSIASPHVRTLLAASEERGNVATSLTDGKQRGDCHFHRDRNAVWVSSKPVRGESQRWDSNPQPAVYKTAALPIELHWRRQMAARISRPPAAPVADQRREHSRFALLIIGSSLPLAEVAG